MTKGFLLHLSGRDTFGLQLGTPISSRRAVLFLGGGDKLLMKHSNIMDSRVVKAVMTRRLVLALGAFPVSYSQQLLAMNPPEILHLKLPFWYYEKTLQYLSYLTLLIDHYKEKMAAYKAELLHAAITCACSVSESTGSPLSHSPPKKT